MSAILLSKLDIDVLVQLAWLGPARSKSWNALTDDADALGTMLWSRNHERAADTFDEPRPVYHFTPLPIAVTAIEGVKQCDYYAYQTADRRHAVAARRVGEAPRGAARAATSRSAGVRGRAAGLDRIGSATAGRPAGSGAPGDRSNVPARWSSRSSAGRTPASR